MRGKGEREEEEEEEVGRSLDNPGGSSQHGEEEGFHFLLPFPA